MRLCLFCNSRANTREDVWPKWLLSCIDEDPKAPTEYWNSIYSPPKTWSGAKFKTKYVCEQCNGGWMSSLEGHVRRTMGALIHDFQLSLDAEQQKSIALWAIKTAIVFEGAKQGKNQFYTLTERELLPKTLDPGKDTAVWLGRCSQSYLLHAEARKLNPRQSHTENPLLDGCATTFVIKRLAIQLVSITRNPEASGRDLRIKVRQGPWNEKLLQIWPIENNKVSWPPDRASATSTMACVICADVLQLELSRNFIICKDYGFDARETN